MIKNNSQLTQAKQNKANILEEIQKLRNADDLHNRMQRASYQCRISDLEKEIEEYKSLLNCNALSFDSETLPKALISLRIASGYTQKKLADELDLPEQQIQRYEQQEYAKVKFERIIQIMRILSSAIELNIRLKASGINPFKQTDSKLGSIRSVIQERKSIMQIA